MEFTWRGRIYPYTVVRKKVRHVTLHVREDGVIWLSAPPSVPEAEIARFVEKNAASVAEMVARAERRQAEKPDFSDGSGIRYLGQSIRLQWADRPCPTSLENGVLTVFARSPEEAQYAYRQWLIEACVSLCRRINQEVCEAFRKAGYSVPLARIEIKEMRSRWGSCTAKKGRISMNFRLMQYPLGCMYAVFYHEYAHFMHQDHSADFYRVLRGVYPEYDRWDAILKDKKGAAS